MAYARSIMALCAVVNMAAARITDKSLPVLGLDASGVLPHLCAGPCHKSIHTRGYTVCGFLGLSAKMLA